MDEIATAIRGLAQRYGAHSGADSRNETVHALHRDRALTWKKVRDSQAAISRTAVAPRPSLSGAASERSRLASLLSATSSSQGSDEATVPWGVVDPTGDPKIAWDCFVGGCVIYLTMSMPYAMGYNAEATWNRARVRYVVDWLVDGVFFVDMCLCFCVAYTNKDGVLVTRRSKVFAHYLFSFGFVIDFLSIASRITHFSQTSASALLRSARLLRTMRLTKLFKLTRILKLKRRCAKPDDELDGWRANAANNESMQASFESHGALTTRQGPRVSTPEAVWAAIVGACRHPAVQSAARMFVVLFVVAHMVACLWHGLTVLKEQDSTRDVARHWINANGLRRKSAWRRYLVSLYWAFTTMTTVGYGDIRLVTNSEKGVAIVVMIIGGICFGYIIGNVTTMFENLNTVAALREQKLDAVKEYLYDRGYPRATAIKVKHHFRHVYETFGAFFDSSESDVYAELPASLIVELLHEQHAELIQQSVLLTNAFATGAFVAAVCRSLVPCKADDGEVIFVEGEIGTHVYLVHTGAVKLVATTPAADASPVTGSQCDVAANNGVNCGLAAPGELVGTEAALITFTHVVSAFTYAKANLFVITKENLVVALENHAPSLYDWLVAKAKQTIETVKKAKRDPGASRVTTTSSSTGGDKTTAVQDDAIVATTESLGEVAEQLPPKVIDERPTGFVRSSLMALRDWATRRYSRSQRVFPSSAPPRRAEENMDRQVRLTSKELYARYGMFHPESGEIMFWDVIMSLLIMFSVLSYTYVFAFGLPPYRMCGVSSVVADGWLAFFLCIDLCFILDMLVTCNTAVVAESPTSHAPPKLSADVASTDATLTTLITSRQAILRRYTWSGWLAIDFMSSVPLDKVCWTGGGSTTLFTLLKCLRALRLVRLVKMRKKFKFGALTESIEDRTGINPALFKLVKPLFVMAVVAHAFTCLFFYVARMRRRQRDSWIDINTLETNKTIRDEDRPSQYLAAMYWALATMTTVGYGDLAPSLENPTGLVVGIVSQVLGTMIFAYVIGILVALVTNLNPSARLFHTEQAYMRHYLAELPNTSKALNARLARAQTHSLNVRGVFNELDVLDKLPPYLRSACLLFVHRDALPYMPFLGLLEQTHMGSLALLLPRLAPANYLVGQIINSPQINARELQFVLAGTAIATRSSSRRYKSYSKERHSSRRHNTGDGENSDRGNHSKHKSDSDATTTNLPPSTEVFRPQDCFGEATLVAPIDRPFKLRCRVICDSHHCHTYVLTKDALEELRSHFEPLVDCIESELDDADQQARWLDFLDDDNDDAPEEPPKL